MEKQVAMLLNRCGNSFLLYPTISVGRDKEGLMWWSVVESWPKLIFARFFFFLFNSSLGNKEGRRKEGRGEERESQSFGLMTG